MLAFCSVPIMFPVERLEKADKEEMTAMRTRLRFHLTGISISLFIAFLGFSLTDMAAQQTTGNTKRVVGDTGDRSSVNLRVAFGYSPRYPIAGQAIQFTDKTSGTPASWEWDFGDGTRSTERNPIHVYATAGFRKVMLVVADTRTSKRSIKTLAIMPPSSPATFVFSPITPGPGQSVQFTDTTAGEPTSWQWNFGDGMTSVLRNPSHSFMNTGTYIVSLSAKTSSWTKQGSQTIIVARMSVLAASFAYSPTSPAIGQVVQFTDTSTGTPTSWFWNFGDGSTSTSQNPSHAFTTAGMKTVTLRVTNPSSSNSTSRTVTVIVTPAASFAFSPYSPAIGQTVQFTDTSTGTPTSWLWNFGDGATSTLRDPNHAYTAAGSYIVNLTIAGILGSDSTSQTVTVGSSSAVIPPDRLIEWSRAGVWAQGVKRIPERTTIFCNVRTAIPGSSLVARGDGASDDTAALQAALNACPEGQVVYVPEGSYVIADSLVIRKGISVKGDGPTRTRIVQHANTSVLRIEGSAVSDEAIVNVTAGFAKGLDTVTVSNAGSYRVGDMVMMDQRNDPELVTQVGEGGVCDWCGRDGGARAMAEVLLVRSISGNMITFNRPLHYHYGREFAPQLSIMSRSYVRNAGVEDLHIEAATGNTEGGGIILKYCAYSWVKNVESYNIPGKHFEMSWGSYGNEVRDSYIHHTPRYDGDHGYGGNIHAYASDNLVENNIFYYLHLGVVIGSAGGAGNVIAYNYMERTQHHQPNWFIGHIGTHGAHAYMNLFEGNVVSKTGSDSYWGSGSHNVFFRNRITRENPGQPVNNDINAVQINSLNYYVTYVGNILGTPGCAGVVEQIPLESRWENPTLWVIGFAEDSSLGYPSDPKVKQTLIREGNWECPTNAVQWSAGAQVIPDSLYLSSKPPWFGMLAWPSFTPERVGFDPANFNKIPAQIRFETR